MAGGDALLPLTGVWWDLNTCPVPADFDPGCVRECIESALHKQIGRPSAVTIYAMGNLEYMSSDLLEKISSSGIILIHAPCGGNDLGRFLYEWSDVPKSQAGYIMVISSDNTMLRRSCYLRHGFTKFLAYPKDDRPGTLKADDETLFVKKFFWETLLSDNFDESLGPLEYQVHLCYCDICHDKFESCDEFITHLKSEQHNKKLFGFVPVDSYDKPKHFCPVCNYPAYDEYNMLLHNESEVHNQKMKLAQEEDRESKKRSPPWDLFADRNKKQSLQELVS